MSFKRRVLSALGKDELLEIGRALELEVTTRMTVDELRDSLAASKRAKLAAIVSESLSRDTLKEICLACGLDNSGAAKATLVERILVAGDKGPAYKVEPQSETSPAADGTATLGSLTGLGGAPRSSSCRCRPSGHRARSLAWGYSDAETL